VFSSLSQQTFVSSPGSGSDIHLEEFLKRVGIPIIGLLVHEVEQVRDRVLFIKERPGVRRLGLGKSP
jgi:hypothetical protein